MAPTISGETHHQRRSTGHWSRAGSGSGVEVGSKSDMEHEIESRTRTLIEKDADEDDSTNKGETAPFVACDMCSA